MRQELNTFVNHKTMMLCRCSERAMSSAVHYLSQTNAYVPATMVQHQRTASRKCVLGPPRHPTQGAAGGYKLWSLAGIPTTYLYKSEAAQTPPRVRETFQPVPCAFAILYALLPGRHQVKPLSCDHDISQDRAQGTRHD